MRKKKAKVSKDVKCMVSAKVLFNKAAVTPRPDILANSTKGKIWNI